MVRGKGILGMAVIGLTLTVVVACQGLSPPQQCSVSFPSAQADGVAFARHFTQMALVTEGQPMPASEQEVVVGQGVALEVVAISLADTPVSLCVQERKGGGKVLHDQIHTLPQGESRTRLGPLSPGDHVIRVIVEGVLVRNLTFTVR